MNSYALDFGYFQYKRKTITFSEEEIFPEEAW